MIYVCFDCHLAIELDVFDDDEFVAGWIRASVSHLLDSLGQSCFMQDWPELAEEFSWRPCDCCGSRLGGTRYVYDAKT